MTGRQKDCTCGEAINPILGEYPPECAICRLLKNFDRDQLDYYEELANEGWQDHGGEG